MTSDAKLTQQEFEQRKERLIRKLIDEHVSKIERIESHTVEQCQRASTYWRASLLAGVTATASLTVWSATSRPRAGTNMTRVRQLEPGGDDHIVVVSGTTDKDRVLECSVCKERYDASRDRRRRRMAETVWTHKHVRCKKAVE